MVNVKNVTDVPNDDLDTTTDGYPDTSARAYQMGMDQDMNTDEYWLHHNTTDVYQSYNNVFTDDDMTKDEITRKEHLTSSFTLGMFMWILSPVILMCNGLTIIVVMKYIKKVTPTHVVIAFLAFSGLFVGIVPLLSLTLYLVGDSAQSKGINDLNTWVTLVSRTLNISAILLIAVERCFLVTSLKLYQKYLTVNRQVGLCIAFCALSFLIATIFTLMTDPELKNGNSYQILLGKRTMFLIHILILPIYTLHTCILAFSYLKIYLFLWKHRKTVTSSQSSSNPQNFQKEKKTTVIISIILTVYLIGTLPNFTYTMIIQRNPKLLNVEMVESFRLVWCITTLIDTFIYAWKVPEFQDGYRKILCCLRQPRIIHVLPLPNVESPGNNLPLEPRREIENSGVV